jgi:DNA-binding PadR family transcriptional regulator
MVAAMPPEMREPTFLVLTALTEGPLHGYALVRSVETLSGGRVRLRPGTLYGALDRLGDEGLVRAHGEEIVDGRLRRYYELTPEGIDALKAATDRMAANVTRARIRLQALGVVGA